MQTAAQEICMVTTNNVPSTWILVIVNTNNAFCFTHHIGKRKMETLSRYELRKKRFCNISKLLL